MPHDLRDAAVTVMGLGRFGGGRGVTRWLAERGARVTLSDQLPASELLEPLSQLRDLIASGRVRLQLGGHRREVFVNCDLLVVNPAVPRPWDNPLIVAAADRGVSITTEIGLLLERLPRRQVIGVTGTAGKSTTSAMIHHALSRLARGAHLGGNIGGSLLNQIPDIEADHWVVLELSSAMLYWLGERCVVAGEPWSPATAVLTNLEPNHLDWHGSFEHYSSCKAHIFAHQQDGDAALRGEGEGAAPRLSLAVPGEHNQRNAHLAVDAVAAATGLNRPAVAEALIDFPGLPHRLQLVGERDGVRFVNDSKSTTPQATRLAVDAFGDPSRVHLIAGGYDKQVDLTPIVTLADRLAGLYTIGATGAGLATHPAAEYCRQLDTAVARAMPRLNPGDTLLLSPGCASWDQFANYEERGRAFVAMVRVAATRDS